MAIQTAPTKRRSSATGATVLVSVGCLLLFAHSAQADRPSDTELTSWVEAALAADPRVTATGIDVSTEHGIVTLRGSVPTLAGKRYGLLTAQRMRGALAVIDQVDVDTSPRPDTAIERDVERALKRSPAIESDGLEVSVKSATVLLTGTVPSWSQRLEAELLVSEIRGVRAVDNQLRAEIETRRSDEAVKRDIEAALQRDAYLVGLPIRVSVKAGAVTLSGSVSAPYEKTRAATQAGWVANVRSVSNQIELEWWPDRSARVGSAQPRSDAELTEIVRAELAQDDRIDASKIESKLAHGRVTLLGSVPSERQRRLAEEDARNVVGVLWVKNELSVAFAERPDAAIRTDIDDAFAADSALFESKISLSVNEGVVKLTGDVGSGYHRAHAAAIASRTLGVRQVVNGLRTFAVVAATDEAIAREVERRLVRDWRTGRVASRIVVDVEDGVVTLSGDVDRVVERRAAARIARRAPGVVGRVRNELVVDPYPESWKDLPEPEGSAPDAPDWELYWDYQDLPWVAEAAWPRLNDLSA